MSLKVSLKGKPDAISRSELLRQYDAVHKGPPGEARALIENAPPVNAPEKVVRFNRKDGERVYCCPKCQADVKPFQPYHIHLNIKFGVKFCWNCGQSLDWSV